MRGELTLMTLHIHAAQSRDFKADEVAETSKTRDVTTIDDF